MPHNHNHSLLCVKWQVWTEDVLTVKMIGEGTTEEIKLGNDVALEALVLTQENNIWGEAIGKIF